MKPPLIEPADPHGVPVATHFTQLGGAWNNDIALGSSENPFFLSESLNPFLGFVPFELTEFLTRLLGFLWPVSHHCTQTFP